MGAGLSITLISGDGVVVRQIPDRLGGTFDASGDFGELLGSELLPRLNRVDSEGSTSLPSSEMTEISAEVDALLRTTQTTRDVLGDRHGAALPVLIAEIKRLRSQLAGI